MRYTITSILFIVLLFPTYTFVGANGAPEQNLIKTYHEDVTGDTHKESISLYGTPLSSNSDYYIDIWAIVTFPDQTEKKISYKGGYQPKLTFIDMNQDQINDIMFSSTVNQQEEIMHYQLNSIKRNKLSSIALPTQHHIKGIYQDQFKIELQISPTDDNELINVKNRAKKYVESGIYNDKGKLLQTTSIHTGQAIVYEPVFLSSSKGYGLKSNQQINGIDNSDKLGTIETLWYYEADKWIILQYKWKTASEN